MEQSKLLQEATEAVFQWAKKYDEANSKLHLLQQEYDKLKRKSEMQEAAIELLLEKFAALKDKADKMELTLIEISSEPHSYGEAGCTWGDSHYDSVSAAAGYNLAIDNVSAKANAALSSYNSNTNQNENT